MTKWLSPRTGKNIAVEPIDTLGLAPFTSVAHEPEGFGKTSGYSYRPSWAWSGPHKTSRHVATSNLDNHHIITYVFQYRPKPNSASSILAPSVNYSQ